MLIWADAVRTKKGESERAGRGSPAHRKNERAGEGEGADRTEAAKVRNGRGRRRRTDGRADDRGGILNRTQEKVANLVVDSLSLREPVPSFTHPITNLPVAATLAEVAWLHGGVSVSNFIESSPRFTYKVCGLMLSCVIRIIRQKAGMLGT